MTSGYIKEVQEGARRSASCLAKAKAESYLTPFVGRTFSLAFTCRPENAARETATAD